jgi:hypothetical protein
MAAAAPMALARLASPGREQPVTRAVENPPRKQTSRARCSTASLKNSAASNNADATRKKLK